MNKIEQQLADALSARADAVDDPGEFGCRRERKWRLVLVFAGDDQGIKKIERDRLHGHDGLARADARRVDIVQFECVRRTEMGTENGFHAPVAPRCKARSNRAELSINVKAALGKHAAERVGLHRRSPARFELDKIKNFAINAVCCDGLVVTIWGHCRADADAATADAATMEACVFAARCSGDALSCTRPAIYAGDRTSRGHASQAAQTRGQA